MRHFYFILLYSSLHSFAYLFKFKFLTAVCKSRHVDILAGRLCRDFKKRQTDAFCLLFFRREVLIFIILLIVKNENVEKSELKHGIDRKVIWLDRKT